MTHNVKYLFVFLLLSALYFACSEKTDYKDAFADLSDEERTELAKLYRKKYDGGSDGALLELEMYDTLIAIEPWNPDHYRMKSIFYFRTGHFLEGMDLLEQTIVADSVAGLGYRGWLKLMRLHDYDGAVADLEDYIALDGDYDFIGGGALYNLALAHKEAGRSSKALKYFYQYFKEAEEEDIVIYYWLYRGITYMDLNNYKKAIEDFDHLLSIWNKCPEAYFYKAEALKLQGKDITACIEYERALKNSPYLHQNPYLEYIDQIYEEQIMDSVSVHCYEQRR